jgi:hypothetical protein
MKSIHLAILSLFFLSVCGGSTLEDTLSQNENPNLTQGQTMEIPIGGNSWAMGGIRLNADGISNWTNTEDSFSSYFSVNQGGQLQLSLECETGGGLTELRITLAGQSKTISINASESQSFTVGTFEIPEAGYLEIKVEALSMAGESVGQFSSWQVSGTPINEATAFVPDNEGNAFYWTRRGPSVHLRYETAPEDEAIEWYYGEIEVPEGNDVIGSYYMAHGFNGGYFGFQVNSESERRVLFSVWSPFQTDNPQDIPEEDRIKLHAKGAEVYTGEFGNEGSGGQSFLRYMWKAGLSYKFLLQGLPLGNGYTRYTAWFYAADEQNWRLIASFDRPKTESYLKGWYSFLENFRPDTGPITRMAYFKNQWYLPAQSQVWREATRARFTADNTARSNWRTDYDGGSAENAFFLRNCGFFYPPTPFNQDFARMSSGQAPAINLQALPMQ